jgi:prophage regulatory protein
MPPTGDKKTITPDFLKCLGVGSVMATFKYGANMKKIANESLPFYAQLQTNTPTPEIAEKSMAAGRAASPTEQPPLTKRFIFKGEVLERVGVSGVCLWRWMRDGKFPVARSVGGRMAWLESEIDEWMESRPLRNYKSRQLA